jgi:phosphatidylglycerophosphate synthase
MITRAIVVIAAGAVPEELLRPIAGVPALLRLLLSAQRAGVSEILVVGVPPTAPALQGILQDHRLMARVISLEDQPWSALMRVAPELEKTWWEGDLWVLPASGVIDVMLLRELAQRVVSQPVAVVETWPTAYPAEWPACFRVSGPWLQTLLRSFEDMPFGAVLATLIHSPAVACLPNTHRVCVPRVTNNTLAAVEEGLFAGLPSASDGWVDRHVNRKFSPWFSRWFLRTGLSPNQVTLMALALGLIAAFGFAQEAWRSQILGALCLQFSAVIDCCDGEVARLKFLESPSGYYLDIACDNIVHVAVFLAIAWSSYTSLGQSYLLWLGGLAAFGTIAAFLVVLATRHGRAQHASAALDGLIDALTNRDFSILLIVCALVGKLDWFLWALAIGVNLFWPMALGLGWKTYRTTHG